MCPPLCVTVDWRQETQLLPVSTRDTTPWHAVIPLHVVSYRHADNSRPMFFTVSTWEWVYATNLSRLQRETSKQHVGKIQSVQTTAILLPQRLSCCWGKIVLLRMLTNLRLADLRPTTAQQRSTGQNLPSDLHSLGSSCLWKLMRRSERNNVTNHFHSHHTHNTTRLPNTGNKFHSHYIHDTTRLPNTRNKFHSHHITNKQTDSMVWVRERTIPTERPPLVGEVIANFCG
jgi:hypothetical protein